VIFFQDALREVTGALKMPTIIILLLLMAVAVVAIGSIVAEYFSERKKMKANIPQLIDNLQNKSFEEMKAVINDSGLLRRQKTALCHLIDRSELPAETREALARQLLFEEENRYAKITGITDFVSKIAPMFGLMGTLIPLGPGLIALGQGDTKTLADSMLIAFDTTVAGLISAAVTFVISHIRKRWYEQYVVSLETMMETILERQKEQEVA